MRPMAVTAVLLAWLAILLVGGVLVTLVLPNAKARASQDSRYEALQGQVAELQAQAKQPAVLREHVVGKDIELYVPSRVSWLREAQGRGDGTTHMCLQCHAEEDRRP